MDLECIVEDLGHHAIGPAASIEQALALLDSLPGPPDAAIIDANLGGRSARPVLEALVALQVPVIVASGYTGEELEKLGMGGVSLSKPYSLDKVARQLQALTSSSSTPG